MISRSFILKTTLKAFLLFFILIIVSFAASYIYIDSETDKLVYGYPSWNKEAKSYELLKERPKNWVSLDKISNDVKWAIILSEDWAFYDHDGLDYNQLEIVLEESLEDGKISRGASTITQQLVKNALLTQDKTFTRKAKEMLLTLMVEKKMSKDEILEKYLNMIELGKDLYGVGLAAKYYFNKNSSELNPKEGAFLAMLLPSPVKYSQSFRDKKLTDFANEQVSSILMKMKQAHKITPEQREFYVMEDLSFEKKVKNAITPKRDILKKIKTDLDVFDGLEFYE